MRLIDQLRAEEATSVVIYSDNPDFEGPNSAIEVSASWTNWQERRFVGDSLLEALRAAVAASAMAPS
jgi:hypothetical protein